MKKLHSRQFLIKYACQTEPSCIPYICAPPINRNKVADNQLHEMHQWGSAERAGWSDGVSCSAHEIHVVKAITRYPLYGRCIAVQADQRPISHQPFSPTFCDEGFWSLVSLACLFIVRAHLSVL
jgi:hypothetical protein